MGEGRRGLGDGRHQRRPERQGRAVAEAGQRLYVKIYDKDLVVQHATGGKINVELQAKSGDKETLQLEPLGRSGEYYIGSLPTTMGPPKPGDNTLQLIGGDSVSLSYTDKNTESGKQDVVRTSEVKVVSSAAVGFTDGAYREYTKGVFGDQECFLRVKDLDRDTSDQADTLTVKLYAEHKVESDAPTTAPPGGRRGRHRRGPRAHRRGPGGEGRVRQARRGHRHADRDRAAQRHLRRQDHPRIVTAEGQIPKDGKTLCVMKGDELVMEYLDETNIGGEPRPVKTRPSC